MERLIKLMQRIGDILNYCTAVVAATTFAIMSVIVITQVVSRSFFRFSFLWAEEVGRYLFIWSIMTAVACATRSRMHISVDFFVDNLKSNAQRSVRIVAQLLLLFAAWVLLHHGSIQAARSFASGQTATSFPVPAGVLFLSVPVSGALIFFHGFTQLLELIYFGKYKNEAAWVSDAEGGQ
jgi:TRAP-type C4-dicarboxylate transport system permease small subunit